MVHPAIYAALVFGGVVVVGMKLYEEYLENRSYEQFQRNRTRYEREYNRFHRSNNDFDFDDDREDEEEFVKREEDSTFRKRKPFGSSSSNNIDNDVIERSILHENDPDQYELSELENSISERKRRLMAEQAFLDQEEENLRNRKHAFMKNFDDVTSLNHHIKFSSNSSSDNEDDEHSLKAHMTVFDPFADQFQDSHDSNDVNNSLSNSDSTERMVVVDNTVNQQSSSNPLSSSAELRFPSPQNNTPPTSNTTSVADSEHSAVRASDSEESWDAVSEMEDWNQSSAYESDGEYQSHHSIASDSDEDKLRF